METLRFVDFDEYGAAIADADIDFQLMRVFERHWTIRHTLVDNIRLQHCIEGSNLHSRGAMAPDGWAVFAQLNESRTSVNGVELLPGSIAIMPARAEFYFSGAGRCEYCTLFVPESRFAHGRESELTTTSISVAPPSGSTTRLLRTIRSLVVSANLHDTSQQGSSSASAALAERLVSEMRQVIDTNLPAVSDFKSPTRRPELVSKSLELIHDSAIPVTSVSTLANTLDVSTRTLLAAFQRELGVTPEAYLLNHRLHRARRILLHSKAEDNTVAKIADSLAFSDAGRFSQRYRLLFGELPSSTLRHKPN